MKNLQQLEDERRQLFLNMDNEKNFSDRSNWVKKLKENERQTGILKSQRMLAEVNRKQAQLREYAKQVWECEQPTEDITTADGSLHKVKAKKYPKLAALQYLRLTFKDGVTTNISVNGEKFQMVKSKYEYNQPTTYTRPASFADFLELNSIQAEEVTAAQFAEFTEKLNAANQELEKAIETYNKQREELNTYRMQHIGLVTQTNKHLYIYEAKRF